MKAILMSIQPKWCELIANGKKMVEVRKTRPNIQEPFKCYIYCTMGKLPKYIYNENLEKESIYAKHPDIINGKVIGEFVCNHITTITVLNEGLFTGGNPNGHCKSVVEKSMLSALEIKNYANGKLYVYAWHITDLVIYDKPKELGEFYTKCKEYDKDEPCCEGCKYEHTEYCGTDCPPYFECKCDGMKPIERPPQSWCYVEV